MSSLSIRTRLYKLAILFEKMKAPKITHICWERLPNESVEHRIDFTIEKKIILKGGGYGSGRRYLYFLWMIRVFFHSFKINKTDIVWALGFESAFPLLLASKMKGYKLYFDDADRFSMLVRNKILRQIIRLLECYVSRNVYRHVIPSFERYNFTSNKLFLIPNTPGETILVKAKEIYRDSIWEKYDLTININGWLSKSRGIEIILDICDDLRKNNIGFIMTGKLDCDEAILLSKKENVNYLGEVSNEEALATYFISDFVFTYYEPITEINRYAASNKWGDALKTGVGIIVNKEIASAQELIEQKIAIGVDYNDIEGLKSEILNLSKNKNKVNSIKERALKIGKETPYFDHKINKMFATC